MHSVAFHIGSLSIYWYGVLVALGFMVGIWSAARRAPHAGISGEVVADLGPWLIVGALGGARLLYVISYWQEQFASKPFSEIFMIRHGGLVFYGGLIGASVTTIAYCRIKKLALWKVADIFAPSIAIGHAFGRIGCFMNGCCYGKACTLPWAVHFPATHQTAGDGIHPTQLYESSLNLLLFFYLCHRFKKRQFDGQVFALYLMCFSVARSTVEFYRGDYPAHYVGGLLTPAHLISALLFAAGAVLWKWRSAQSPVRPPAQ